MKNAPDSLVTFIYHGTIILKVLSKKYHGIAIIAVTKDGITIVFFIFVFDQLLYFL